MRTAQRSALDKAIERATELGIEVVGHGRLRATNQRIYLVPSQRDSDHWHIVVMAHHKLVCDCEAGKRGLICIHRAATHMELVLEAAKAEANAQQLALALEQEEKAARDAANDLRDLDRWDLIEAGNW